MIVLVIIAFALSTLLEFFVHSGILLKLACDNGKLNIPGQIFELFRKLLNYERRGERRGRDAVPSRSGSIIYSRAPHKARGGVT